MKNNKSQMLGLIITLLQTLQSLRDTESDRLIKTLEDIETTIIENKEK